MPPYFIILDVMIHLQFIDNPRKLKKNASMKLHNHMMCYNSIYLFFSYFGMDMVFKIV